MRLTNLITDESVSTMYRLLLPHVEVTGDEVIFRADPVLLDFETKEPIADIRPVEILMIELLKDRSLKWILKQSAK